MDYKTSYKVWTKGLFLGVGVGFIGLFFDVSWVLFLAFGIMLVSVTQTYFFYRCPHCKARLFNRGVKPARCPDCGNKIKWD